MRHRDVAYKFTCKRKATGSRMYCEDTEKGFTIFSYGEHFPIARHTSYGYVFNSDDYSSSTATHKGYVRSALDGYVINLPNCDETKVAEQLKEDENHVEHATKKLSRVRTENMKNKWVAEINEAKENIHLIKKYILPKLVMEAL